LQAQGEAVLRKALSELKLWSLQREFTFVENNTEWGGKVRKTPLIKVRSCNFT
jgi:dynein heavy chain 2, cytosolic